MLAARHQMFEARQHCLRRSDVVETRGIEPLTPALQTCSGTLGRTATAGQGDHHPVQAALVAHHRPRFGAIAGAIASTVDIQDPPDQPPVCHCSDVRLLSEGSKPSPRPWPAQRCATDLRRRRPDERRVRPYHPTARSRGQSRRSWCRPWCSIRHPRGRRLGRPCSPSLPDPFARERRRACRVR